MSFNQSMNISLGSMKNNQYALTVVSQNIANLHVEGYRRQRVDFQTNEYTTNCENVLSTIRGMNGASISSLSDYVDEGAFRDLLDSNSDAQYYNTLADALGGLEDITDDLGDNGLNALLNDFFKASANLEQFPADITIRTQFLNAAEAVCDKFNDIDKKLSATVDEQIQSVGSNVETINSLFETLAEYNKNLAGNKDVVQLKTELDSVVQELSNYMDITTTTNPNGTYNLYLGEIAVVEGAEINYTLQVDYDRTNPDSTVAFSLKSTKNPDYVIEKGVNDFFNSGAIKAQIDFLNGSGSGFTNVNDLKSSMNSAASAFADALNAIQMYDDGDVFAASIVTDPNTGDLLLEKAADNGPMVLGTSASDIRISQDFLDNPFLVAAARIDKNKFEAGEDWTRAIGNSDNATKFTDLQNQKICSYGGGVNNCTLSQFLTNSAAKAGLDAADVAKKAEVSQDIADMDATNFANLIGVNLDEELADMIKYQRAYEASSKLFATINDLIGTIINMV